MSRHRSRGKARRVYPYQRIAADLRNQIASGTLKDQLPGEHSLAEQHGVSRETVRRALGLLQGEGLISPDHPRGWFVRAKERMIYRPQHEAHPYTYRDGQPVEAWAGQISEEGRVPTQHIDVGIIAADEGIAERLQLEIGARVVARRRVRSINGSTININDSYYPMALVEGSRVLEPGDVSEGVTRVLIELGYNQVRWVDEIDVAMPTPEQRERLKLDIGTPVAIHTVTAYTDEDVPIRCTVNVLPGDRHHIVYERGAP